LGVYLLASREPRKLVRLDFDFLTDFALTLDIRQPLQMEVAPFIVGVGQVVVERRRKVS
jgi:hypothetical protein